MIFLKSAEAKLLLTYSKIDNLNRDTIRVIEYKESGVKLSEEERLGIAELKSIVASEGVDTIYTSELSRVARTEKVLWSFIEYLQENKIQLKCKNPEFTLLDETRVHIPFQSRLIVSTFGTLATQEAIEKKSRFARGKARKAKEGKYNGGAIPYGYRIDTENGNLIVVDEGGEADVVREIYNMYEHGMSQPKIAKELYKRGYKSRAVRATKTFTISLVHQILTNKLLTGQPQKNKGATYERTYPMIITPEQFERCRKIAAANNTKAEKSERVYYAHSLIECTHCGRKFVSTGNKGYYHCWDAYYPNRDINGYADTPRCTNRTCISTNVMDSLLWALAKEYEASFVLNSAKQHLEDCKQRKSIFETKLLSIESRRLVLEEKMDLLLEARAEGMKKDRFQARKAAIKAEQKEIDHDEANYKEQISQYEILISDLTERLGTSFNISSDEEIDEFLNTTDEIWERIESITDDVERSNIIHKHIEKVLIEPTTINYTFAKYPEGKEVSAKKILVYRYGINRPEEFCFIPNNGKGGLMLSVHPMGDSTIKMGFGDINVRKYSVMNYEYLPRIKDTGKYRRREVERAKRESIKSIGTNKLRKQGYISMNEMRDISKLSYGSVYYAIKTGKLKAKNMFRTWYALKTDFESYLETYKPKARPSRQKNHPHNLTPEEKLYNTIINL